MVQNTAKPMYIFTNLNMTIKRETHGPSIAGFSLHVKHKGAGTTSKYGKANVINHIRHKFAA